MISYEELVEALDRYVAKNGGTPMSARASASSASPSFAPPPAVEAPAHDIDMAGGYDEPHDPDMPRGGEEDATHVGASVGGSSMPPPLQPVHDEGSNEIDIGDVLTDDEM
jgi:hypothetical protein